MLLPYNQVHAHTDLHLQAEHGDYVLLCHASDLSGTKECLCYANSFNSHCLQWLCRHAPVFWRRGKMGERGRKSHREDSLCLDKNIMLISTDGMRNTEKVHDSLIGFWQNMLASNFHPPLSLNIPVCGSSFPVTKTKNDCFILTCLKLTTMSLVFLYLHSATKVFQIPCLIFL